MALGFLVLGLVQGALAGLNALGFVLLWRTTRVVNLAQPAVGLVGGVLTGMLVSESGWSFWWAAPLGVAVGAALGFASERLVMVRLASLPRVVPMVATVGLASVFQALQTAIPFLLDGRLPSYDVDIGIEWFVFPVLLKGPHLLALSVLPVSLGTLFWFVHRSRIGTAAVAVGQDIERAQALGVNAGFVRAVSWSAAGALSGVAGVLSIPVLGYSLGDGVAPTVLLLALAPAVLAGMRSLPWTAMAALGVGVGYQFALVHASTAGLADVALAVVIVVALAARRRPIEREAVASRASSWAAATTAAMLPRAVQRDPRWRRWVRPAALTLVPAVAIPPLWLSPSGDVRYGTGAALVIAAIAAATAWIFSGEIALGHWGIAALGATACGLAPGPIVVRVALGIAVGVAAGLGLAIVGQRRGGLTTAVAGLALSVAAPYWLLRSATSALDVDGQTAAVVSSAVAATAAVAISWLRGRRSGLRMIAARDDPGRARALGVDPRRARFAGMALSGGLAGLAGVLYLACVPAGVAPGAFEASRSLDVLAFAVVGGLGSALGTGVGASALIGAGMALPPPWGSVATGFGVLAVVLFAPAGVSGALATIRDGLARAVCGQAFPPRVVAITARAATPFGSHDDAQDAVAVVAGADTRDALQSATVRAAVVAAFCFGAPTLAAIFSAPLALRDHLGVDVGRFAPWAVLVLGGVAGCVALVAWSGRRWPNRDVDDSVAPEVIAAAGLTAALVAFVASGDRPLVTVALVAGPSLGAWVLARIARAAMTVVVLRTRSAAAGLVASATAAGGLGAVHLGAVAAGNDVLAAAGWAAVYLGAGTIATAAVFTRAPQEAARSRQRRRGLEHRSIGRRYWAPLRIDALTVDYGTHRILDAVDVSVSSGQIVAVVGGNGAGKSTLLRTVAGFTTPVGGRIDVAGEEVTTLRADQRAAVGVAFVSGSRPVFADLTVRENLRVGAYLTHRTSRSFEEALEHVVALVPLLAGRLDTRAGLLSGGEQRQLAIAQTLFRRPTLLLADELTLGLDVGAQAIVLGLLRALADDGIGVIVVDHDLSALTKIADRFVAVHDATTTEFDGVDELSRAKGAVLPARFLTAVTR